MERQDGLSPIFTYARHRFIDRTEKVGLLQSGMTDAVVPHNHEFMELVYVTSGRGLHTVNNRSFQVSAGDLFFIRMDATHAFHPMPGRKEPFHWMNVLFLPEFIAFDCSSLVSERKYNVTDVYEAGFIIHAMHREFTQKKFGYLEKMKGYLHVLLSELARLNREAERQAPNDYGRIRKTALAKQAASWVAAHYRETVRLEMIASELGISVSYVNKLCREHLGASFVDYVNRCRLEASCRMLLERGRTVREVALACGFSDERFYRGYFKRHLGLTPTEYRRKHAGGGSPA